MNFGYAIFILLFFVDIVQSRPCSQYEPVNSDDKPCFFDQDGNCKQRRFDEIGGVVGDCDERWNIYDCRTQHIWGARYICESQCERIGPKIREECSATCGADVQRKVRPKYIYLHEYDFEYCPPMYENCGLPPCPTVAEPTTTSTTIASGPTTTTTTTTTATTATTATTTTTTTKIVTLQPTFPTKRPPPKPTTIYGHAATVPPVSGVPEESQTASPQSMEDWLVALIVILCVAIFAIGLGCTIAIVFMRRRRQRRIQEMQAKLAKQQSTQHSSTRSSRSRYQSSKTPKTRSSPASTAAGPRAPINVNLNINPMDPKSGKLSKHYYSLPTPTPYEFQSEIGDGKRQSSVAKFGSAKRSGSSGRTHAPSVSSRGMRPLKWPKNRFKPMKFSSKSTDPAYVTVSGEETAETISKSSNKTARLAYLSGSSLGKTPARLAYLSTSSGKTAQDAPILETCPVLKREKMPTLIKKAKDVSSELPTTTHETTALTTATGTRTRASAATTTAREGEGEARLRRRPREQRGLEEEARRQRLNRKRSRQPYPVGHRRLVKPRQLLRRLRKRKRTRVQRRRPLRELVPPDHRRRNFGPIVVEIGNQM